MGPSGSARRRLLNLIGGLDVPTAGSITVAGQAARPARLGARSPSGVPPRSASSSSSTTSCRCSRPSATSSCRLLLTKLSSAERKKRAAIALQLVGLADRASATSPASSPAASSSASRSPGRSSSDPMLLVCDEPTGDLDRTVGGRGARPPARAQSRSRQDRAHGDARPQGGRVCQPHRCISTRGCWWKPRRCSLNEAERMKYLHLIWAALFRRKDADGR